MEPDGKPQTEKPPAYDNYSLLLGVIAVLFVGGAAVGNRGSTVIFGVVAGAPIFLWSLFSSLRVIFKRNQVRILEVLVAIAFVGNGVGLTLRELGGRMPKAGATWATVLVSMFLISSAMGSLAWSAWLSSVLGYESTWKRVGVTLLGVAKIPATCGLIVAGFVLLWLAILDSLLFAVLTCGPVLLGCVVVIVIEDRLNEVADRKIGEHIFVPPL